MSVYYLGPLLLGLGLGLVVFDRPKPEPDHEPETWATTNPGPDPLPPTDCDLCGGGREVWVDEYHAIPCRWCARTGAHR